MTEIVLDAMAHELATNTAPPTVVFRTVTRRDLPFITSTWLKANRRRGFKHLDRRVYFYWHHKLLEQLIPSSNVIIACDREDPDKLYGWGCARSEAPTLIVHFVYVREGWRGQGIGSRIVEQWIERFEPSQFAWTHTTEGGESFIKHLRRSGMDAPGIFNPYLGYIQWMQAETQKDKR